MESCTSSKSESAPSSSHRCAISQQFSRISCQQCPKATIIIMLVWNALVGCVFAVLILFPLEKYVRASWFHFSHSLVAYVLVGIVQMLHPIGGLIADLRYGRYKVIGLSILLIWCGFQCLTIVGIIYATANTSPSTIDITEILLNSLAIVFIIVGLSGFRSNAVQFSLEQLIDAPSERLSSFLHWFVWAEHFGEMTARLLVTAILCNERARHKFPLFYSTAYLTVSTVIAFLTYCVRNLFYKETVASNPYRNVWKVLKFTFKHSKPLGYRSAFTYSDDVRPSRMDFAKRLYGGPFQTEIVEDVKTFCRIVLMLVATTPVFWLEVPASYLFPLFGLHLSQKSVIPSYNDSCSYQWMLFESGNLSSIISVAAIPLSLLLIYPHVKKWVPGMIGRLGIGIFLMGASITSMLIIQAVANNHNAFHHSSIANATCLFPSEYQNHSPSTLEFPTQALVVTNLLYGVAAPLISITVLEFVSAQSPHTMKGVLLGVYYAFRGLFITLGSVATFPFAQERLWGEHDGMFSCGFYYYLSNSVFGVFGLVVFMLAARWYRNRERDDPPYTHQYAENCYERLVDGNDMHDSYGTAD